MTEETKSEETPVEEPKPSYAVHSVARSRYNRTERAQRATRARFKQYIGDQQMRLVRNRPVIITEEVLLANLEELRAKTAEHLIKVTTVDGRDVDLETFAVAPAPPAEPKPTFKPDSIADDKPWGIKMEPGEYLDQNALPAHVLPGDAKPELLAEGFGQEEPVAPAVEAAPDQAAQQEAELDAALAAAEAEAAAEEPLPVAEEPAPAAPAQEEVPSPKTAPEGGKKGKGNR